MAKCRTPVYTGAAAETENLINAQLWTDGRMAYTVNRYYKHTSGNFYFYYNRAGYVHLVRPARQRLNGKIWYSILDRILTKDNYIKDTALYGKFDTLEDCIKAIEENME